MLMCHYRSGVLYTLSLFQFPPIPMPQDRQKAANAATKMTVQGTIVRSEVYNSSISTIYHSCISHMSVINQSYI